MFEKLGISRLASLAVGGLLVFSAPANAGVITQAVSVASSSNNGTFNNPNNLANQTGLSANYISGVTDFDTYLATTTHKENDPGDSWGATSDNPGQFTDFDFGVPINLTRLALFGDDSPNGNNIQDFTILISNDATFASFANLGGFTATDTNLDPIAPQIFDVSNGIGRFVRVQLDSNHGGSTYLYGEAVFEASALRVSEPGSFAILGLALAGLGFARRRKTA